MSRSDVINLLYIVAFSMFITGLRMLRGPRTAVRGNQVAAVGMAIAVVATLLTPGVGSWALMIISVAIGVAIGVPSARSVKMTAMPQMVALFNGVGGGAVALLAYVEFRSTGGDEASRVLIPGVFSAIVGSVSFWGSLVAFAKLQELISGRPIRLPGGPLLTSALAVMTFGWGIVICAGASFTFIFPILLVLAALLGLAAVLPIGGADMPVVISTL